jgi:hypothetical protein
MEKNKIITYSCSNNVHIFEPKCGFMPAFPYMIHKNIESAIDYLKKCGKEDIEVKTYKTIKNETKIR